MRFSLVIRAGTPARPGRHRTQSRGRVLVLTGPQAELDPAPIFTSSAKWPSLLNPEN
jgi:hypothetical protein